MLYVVSDGRRERGECGSAVSMIGSFATKLNSNASANTSKGILARFGKVMKGRTHRSAPTACCGCPGGHTGPPLPSGGHTGPPLLHPEGFRRIHPRGTPRRDEVRERGHAQQ